ncbi:MAG TPA: hypothetical protein VN213_02720 [Solirubrobacteraceae bacterium]|nr:hypothetical protein [Solirubrobacteraceae bacterium]
MRLPRPLAAMLIAIAALLAASAPADASRRATDAETLEMAEATGFRPECFFAHISTIDDAWALGTEVGIGSCQRGIGNGYIVMYRDPAEPRVWEEVLQASDGHDIVCDDYGIPLDVARDLSPMVPICVRQPPRPAVVVLVQTRSGLLLRERPRSMAVGAKGAITRMRWRRWGGPVAVGRGHYTIAGFAGEPDTGFSGTVTIRFSRPRTCRSGDRVYTRLRITTRKRLREGMVLPYSRGGEWADCADVARAAETGP